MTPVIHFLNVILPILYLGTFSVYFYDLTTAEKKFPKLKRLFIFITLFTHLIYLLIRTSEFAHPTITNIFEIFRIKIALKYFFDKNKLERR